LTFLTEDFIPKFNKKFGVIPTKEGDLHEPLTKEDKKNLNRIFAIQSYRIVNNDFTIQLKNTWYQLTEIQPTTIRPKEQNSMKTWLDGSVHIVLREQEFNYFLLSAKPQKQVAQPAILTSHSLMYKPPSDHPWRHFKRKKG